MARLGTAVRLVAVLLCGPMTASADTVLDWNANAINTRTTESPPVSPFAQSRYMAINQLAVFEAVNAITGDYEPYLGSVVATADSPTVTFLNRTPGSGGVFEEPSITIKFGDLNTASPEGARILYGRIQSAARAVCGASYRRVPGSKWEWKICYEATVNRAVVRLNRPALTALHRHEAAI